MHGGEAEKEEESFLKVLTRKRGGREGEGVVLTRKRGGGERGGREREWYATLHWTPAHPSETGLDTSLKEVRGDALGTGDWGRGGGTGSGQEPKCKARKR